MATAKKAPVTKTAPKAKTTKVAAKPVVKKEVTATPKVEKTVKVQTGLTMDMFDAAGKVAGSITLPESVFGVKVNKQLIAQAVRVYLINQRRGTVSTKTRGEVDGSTRKIYRQKGTGRARHGGVRAPIFVKGGLAHGPSPKEYEAKMPKKMKQKAFFSALSSRLQDGGVTVVSGIEKVEQKTKAMAGMFANLGVAEKSRNVLLVLPKDMPTVFKAARNLEGVAVTTAERMNTYEALVYKRLIFMKEAIDVFGKEHKKETK